MILKVQYMVTISRFFQRTDLSRKDNWNEKERSELGLIFTGRIEIIFLSCGTKIARMIDLPELLKNQITQFVDSQDWVSLYRGYQWNYDTWGNGFPYILQLEKQLRFSRQNGHIKGKDVLDIVHWGMFKRKITSPDSISIVEEVLKSDERSSLLQTLI
ncbi:hypothetical protein SBF1_6740004 [Candidatus Desulfosporosinus infrequens]|uniref:Uncharacterized protein n=1 Tax=Candidatus Desulfosporosinus infrequens TaxID=2043169 RepID=A0A2U3LNY1_9FIRM|nr:hypothetical protein SBF1_6740004 [Candidatus Desulfosporosinus infrequens]